MLQFLLDFAASTPGTIFLVLAGIINSTLVLAFIVWNIVQIRENRWSLRQAEARPWFFSDLILDSKRAPARGRISRR